MTIILSEENNNNNNDAFCAGCEGTRCRSKGKNRDLTVVIDNDVALHAFVLLDTLQGIVDFGLSTRIETINHDRFDVRATHLCHSLVE